jgi:hypothetical protein
MIPYEYAGIFVRSRETRDTIRRRERGKPRAATKSGIKKLPIIRATAHYSLNCPVTADRFL